MQADNMENNTYDFKLSPCTEYSKFPMKMELTEGSETSAYINQTPGNYPKGNLLYSVHGESLKSRIFTVATKSNEAPFKLLRYITCYSYEIQTTYGC